jgi:predicted ester cyclase
VGLSARYRSYIACLNARDWGRLGDFVDAAVVHNGRPLGLAGYRAMLEDDVATFPDLSFVIALLATEGDLVAARLAFRVTPARPFLGLPPGGRTISFCENIFYRFAAGRFAEAWSIIDKAQVEAELSSPLPRPDVRS